MKDLSILFHVAKKHAPYFYNGNKRKWICILGSQVITNWLTQIPQC